MTTLNTSSCNQFICNSYGSLIAQIFFIISFIIFYVYNPFDRILSHTIIMINFVFLFTNIISI